MQSVCTPRFKAAPCRSSPVSVTWSTMSRHPRWCRRSSRSPAVPASGPRPGSPARLRHHHRTCLQRRSGGGDAVQPSALPSAGLLQRGNQRRTPTSQNNLTRHSRPAPKPIRPCVRSKRLACANQRDQNVTARKAHRSSRPRLVRRQPRRLLHRSARARCDTGGAAVFLEHPRQGDADILASLPRVVVGSPCPEMTECIPRPELNRAWWR